jgi:hypothetical protein
MKWFADPISPLPIVSDSSEPGESPNTCPVCDRLVLDRPLPQHACEFFLD